MQPVEAHVSRGVLLACATHLDIVHDMTCSQNAFLVTTGDAHVYANNACLLVETIYSMHLAALSLALQTQLLVFVTCSSFHWNIRRCAKMISSQPL